jgi:transcriptional regulator with XRE-family HTH domain
MEKEEKIFILKFGENIRKIRLNRSLSQEMLANDANIPINQIGRIERGEINTSLGTLHKIANALEVPIVYLFSF